MGSPRARRLQAERRVATAVASTVGPLFRVARQDARAAIGDAVVKGVAALAGLAGAMPAPMTRIAAEARRGPPPLTGVAPRVALARVRTLASKNGEAFLHRVGHAPR